MKFDNNDNKPKLPNKEEQKLNNLKGKLVEKYGNKEK